MQKLKQKLIDEVNKINNILYKALPSQYSIKELNLTKRILNKIIERIDNLENNKKE